jgi:hypothetical protein
LAEDRGQWRVVNAVMNLWLLARRSELVKSTLHTQSSHTLYIRLYTRQFAPASLPLGRPYKRMRTDSSAVRPNRHLFVG